MFIIRKDTSGQPSEQIWGYVGGMQLGSLFNILRGWARSEVGELDAEQSW